MPCEAKKKQTNGKVQREKKDDIDKCEEESMNPPAGEFRAYGSAVDDDRDFARHQAVLSAKAALADNLETMVMDVMRKYRAQISRRIRNGMRPT